MAGDGHPASRSKALWGAGWLAYHQGDLAAAVARAETLLEVAERTGNPLDERNGLTLRGMAAMADGRYRDSIAPFERGLEICRGLEPGWLLATSALNLGAALMHAGDVERGEILFAEARTRYCELGDQAYEARVKGHLAACHKPAASELLRSYLTTDSGGDWGLAESLEGLSLAASAEGDAFRAGLLDAAAAALRERIGTRPHAFDRALLARYAASLDEHVWDVGWQVGLGMPLPDVIHLAVGP